MRSIYDFIDYSFLLKIQNILANIHFERPLNIWSKMCTEAHSTIKKRHSETILQGNIENSSQYKTTGCTNLVRNACNVRIYILPQYPAVQL